jgi:O-antigen/teichoic acid export membrane protein
VVSAANFLTVFVFARHMSTAAFGAFMIAHTGLMLLTSLQGALLTQPHNVLAAGREDSRYARFTTSLAVAQLSVSALVCALLAGTGFALGPWLPAGTGAVLGALALAALPWMAQEFVRRALYTRSATRAAFANDALSYGLQLAGAIALAGTLGERAGPAAPLAVLGLASAAGAALGAWQIRAHLRPAALCAEGLRRDLAEAWSFGKWLTAQNTLAWLGTHGHAWLVGAMLGAEQVGLYRAAMHLTNLLNPIRQAAFNYLPSRASLAYQRGGLAKLGSWLQRVFWLLLLVPLPLTLLLVAFPGPILELAYGPRYAGPELALLLALAAMAQLLLFTKFPFDLGLLALKRSRSIFYVYLIPVGLLFTTGVALIHFLGILGVPLSSMLINAALLAATGVAYLRAAHRGAPAGAAGAARALAAGKGSG